MSPEATEAARAARLAPVRVAHVIESLGAGGAERLLYTNLKHLDAGDVHSTVVTVFREPDRWAGPLRELGVKVMSLDCRSLTDVARGVVRLRRWLRRRHQRPDLLHTHLWAANVIGRVAGRLAGVPVLSSIHNPDHEPEAWDDGSGVPVSKRRLAREIDRWTARFGCDRMLAVSEYVRQSAHRRLGFPLERISLIYNPIDAESFTPRVGRTRAELLREHGIPDEGPLLLNVGRVTPQKGLLYAVRALPPVLARHPSARLVSVGPASDRAWLRRLEEEAHALGVRGRVHFLGAREEVAALLHACDVFVFPSLYEGMGIALVEAMAAGCACVASEVGPIPEVLRHGVDGWLVKPGDAEALAAAVNELLDDPARRASLATAARESALARFRPEPAAFALAALYVSMVEQGKTGRF